MNMCVPSGKEASFWHCLLEGLNEAGFPDWTTRKQSVRDFRYELHKRACDLLLPANKRTNLLLRNMTITEAKLCACRQPTNDTAMPNELDLFVVALLLDLRLIVLERFPLESLKDYGGMHPKRTLVLYNDNGWFSLLKVNGALLQTEDSEVTKLLQTTSNGQVPTFFKERYKPSGLDEDEGFHCQVMGITPEEALLQQQNSRLHKYKLSQLKETVDKLLPNAIVKGRVTKATLVEALTSNGVVTEALDLLASKQS